MTSHRGFGSVHLAGKLRTAAVALVMAGAATLASAARPNAPDSSSFLALGDSVVFGYIANDLPAYVNPNNFVGYPEYVGGDVHLDTANAACPGETTTGFISATSDPLLDNGCHFFFRAKFPLHVAYASTTQSQLDYATHYLATHRHTRLVTISLGANDVFVLQGTCSFDPGCIAKGLPAVLTRIYLNMNSILGSLRATGFRGVLMVVNYYSPDYTNPLDVSVIGALNQTLAAVAAANGAVVADAFTAFQTAAFASGGGKTCVVGLLNVNPLDPTQMSCDVHPSQSGQQLLSDTVEATYQAALPAHGDD